VQLLVVSGGVDAELAFGGFDVGGVERGEVVPGSAQPCE
jgi:hypothetical protein